MLLDLLEATKYKTMNPTIQRYEVQGPKQDDDKFGYSDTLVFTAFGYEDYNKKKSKVREKFNEDLKTQLKYIYPYLTISESIVNFINSLTTANIRQKLNDHQDQVRDIVEPGTLNDFIEYYSDKNNLNRLKKIFSTFYASMTEDYTIIKNITKMVGMSWADISNTFRHIVRYRNMSGRAIPSEAYPVLKALTVTHKKLPKKLYRGLYIDGDKFAKLKDKDNYQVGKEIKLNNKKATSWSTSIGTAFEFSIIQDNIKDKENGVSIVLSFTPTSEDDIIANFTNLKTLDYFNQQEVLVSTNVKTAKIEAIEFGKELERNLSKTYDSAWSANIADYVLNLYADTNANPHDKINIKTLSDLTVGEYVDRYPNLFNFIPEKLRNEFKNVNIKAYSLISKYLGSGGSKVDFVGQNEINVTTMFVSNEIFRKYSGIKNWGYGADLNCKFTIKINRLDYSQADIIIIIKELTIKNAELPEDQYIDKLKDAVQNIINAKKAAEFVGNALYDSRKIKVKYINGL